MAATMTTSEERYADRTREDLYELAQQRGIEGRSGMSKDELVAALHREDQGPDAVSLLERQHETLRAHFQEFRDLSSRPSRRKDDLVREIITLLVKHSEIEEMVFYPAVRAELDDAAPVLDESLEEHHAAELLLAELDHLKSDSDRFDAKVTVLIENVEHHIEEEEQELFPKVRDALTEDRRRELGAAMQQAWKVAPTRPHPLSPSTPPGNVIAGLPATMWDLTMTGLRAGARVIGKVVRR